jgi:hypothetical protein
MIGSLLAASVGLAAIDRGPLPVVQHMNIDGRTVTTSQVAREGPWLVLVVRLGCEPCDAILRAARQPDNPS